MQDVTPAHKERGFRIHAITFVLTIIVLLVVNDLTGPPYWVQWVVLGWGLGLFCHWFFVLGPAARKSESS